MEQRLTQSGGFVLPSYTFKDPAPRDPSTAGEEEEDLSGFQEHVGSRELMDRLNVKTEKYSDASFKYWCYDTPGLVNPDQV